MNLPGFLVNVLHFLGLGGGSDSGTTAISTVDDYFSSRLTSTVVFDTSALAKLHSSSSVPPKFISILASTHSTAEEIIGRARTVTGTGITQEVQTTKPSAPPTTTEIPTTTESGSNSTETDHTGGTNTTITGVTGNETTVTGVTGNETTVTEVTGTETTVTGVTGNETTITRVTGNDTTITEPVTTANSTATDQPETTTPGSTVAPTEKPGLSRGAVAGIVIGCLLLVAVVAAAVVFFMKNRNSPPEAQRLRV